MAMLLLKNHLWAKFHQRFQYSLTIKVLYAMLTNLTPPPFCGSIILHKKQATDFFYIPTCNSNLRVFSIAVTVHIINKQRNQSAIIDHLKINCGQSQTAWNYSSDYKALGRKSLTPFDGGLQPSPSGHHTAKQFIRTNKMNDGCLMSVYTLYSKPRRVHAEYSTKLSITRLVNDWWTISSLNKSMILSAFFSYVRHPQRCSYTNHGLMSKRTTQRRCL